MSIAHEQDIINKHHELMSRGFSTIEEHIAMWAAIWEVLLTK